jgi:flavin-dependent dehydrogenase
MRVAIVGAGPAGSYFAWCIASTDHEILLFDPSAPYEKPCGGALGPLVTWQFPDVMALPFPRHYPRNRLLLASDNNRAEQIVEQPALAIASRLAFNQALLNRALADDSVRFVRRRVTAVDRSGNAWHLRTANGRVFPADFLVGADGVRSVVRRQTVGPIQKQHLGLCVGYFVQGAPHDTLVFQTFGDLEGYLWCFPRPDHASVGIGSRCGRIRPKDLRRRLDRFLDDHCPTVRREERWAALLPMAQDPTLWDIPCAGQHWALLGDAAGHVHPITGEGIAYALWSAELLAEAFQEGEPLAYEKLWRARYGHELMRASEILHRSVNSSKRNYEILLHVTLAGGLPILY